MRAFIFICALLLGAGAAAGKQVQGENQPALCDQQEPALCVPIEDLTEIEATFRTIHFERIVDGDTFIGDGKRIRLWGIDAPEEEDVHYLAAKMFLETMIDHGALTCKVVDVDRYQRDVMHCFIDGLDVGSMMVQMGMAEDFRKYSGGYYQYEEDLAKGEKRGIWKD